MNIESGNGRVLITNYAIDYYGMHLGRTRKQKYPHFFHYTLSLIKSIQR